MNPPLIRFFLGSNWARIGAEIKLFFKLLKVFWALGVQRKDYFPVSAVRGAAVVANLLIKAL